MEHLENGQRALGPREELLSGGVGWAWLRPGQMGVQQREGGLATGTSSLTPLPLGPFRPDGTAVAVRPPTSCPRGVRWVPRLPSPTRAVLARGSLAGEKGRPSSASTQLLPAGPLLGCPGEVWRGIQAQAGEPD